MKIAVLSRNPRLYSTRRFVEAGERLGHQVEVIDTMHCYMAYLVTIPAFTFRSFHGSHALDSSALDLMLTLGNGRPSDLFWGFGDLLFVIFLMPCGAE